MLVVCRSRAAKCSHEVTCAKKQLGQFFTPPAVAAWLVRWAGRRDEDRLLDPACGDGQFLAFHRRAVGVEIDPVNVALARSRAPGALIYGGDFFTWAERTAERFESAAGNPPFIRYQNFSDCRPNALRIAAKGGAKFNGLTSSWAPFLVATAMLLKPRGRMAFVVPAEIGHASYARPLLEYLCHNFETVRIAALRDKVFHGISEDAWLLFCDGYGGRTAEIQLHLSDTFEAYQRGVMELRSVSVNDWKLMNGRLRPFLLNPRLLNVYQELSLRRDVCRFTDVATAGIGYVSGANDFFHLRPSEAKLWGIPERLLKPAVRKGDQLSTSSITESVVATWLRDDRPVLLLDLNGVDTLPPSVTRYLGTADAKLARQSYKCQNRDPWYVVPDVIAPAGFLTVMNGMRATLVENRASCVCSNSVHAVRMKSKMSFPELQNAWQHEFTQLSCELEGHPLGGGMLKLEPGEVARTRLPVSPIITTKEEKNALGEALAVLRKWRHYD